MAGAFYCGGDFLLVIGAEVCFLSWFYFIKTGNEFRKQFTKKLDDEKQNKKEYEYVLTQRPFSIGTYPPQDFVRFEDRDFNYGVLVYSEPIPLKDVEHYSLSPITIIKEHDGKILDYKLGNLKLKASTQTFDSLLDLFGMPADTFPKAA